MLLGRSLARRSQCTRVVRKLGTYSLEERIGEGGMAQVFRARLDGPAGFAKDVVIKTIRPHLAAEPAFVERFLDEARISARLQHRNIVQVHHFGLEEGVPFLVMERLDGMTLSQLVASARARSRFIPIGAALAIVRELCHALAYVHEFDDGSAQPQSIVHGDVSPSNVMICRDGTVKLIDFGVARMGRRRARFRSDSVVGKCGYLAPEQVKLEPQDARVDVFAAGIVLHELLGGRRLFAAGNDSATLRLIDHCEVQPPSRLNPAVPAALDAIVLRALARDPEQRFADGAQLGAALDELVDVVATWPRARLATFARELATPVPEIARTEPEGASEPVSHDRVPTVMGLRPAPTRVAKPTAPTPVVEPEPAPPPENPRPRRARPLLLGVALLATCLLAALPLGSVTVDAAEVVSAAVAPQPPPAAPPVALPVEPNSLAPSTVEPKPEPEPESEPAPAPAPAPPSVPTHSTHASHHHHSSHGHHKSHATTVATRETPEPPAHALRQGGLVDPFR